MYIAVRLTPPQGGVLGETDVASRIGKGLVHEALLMIRSAAEAEGFDVTIEVSQVVY